MRNFISYKQSLEILEKIDIKTPPVQKMFLTQALGYVIAEDIVANHNSPEFPTSGMDGYALKAEDLNKKTLKVIDKNPAGSVVESIVTQGVCIKTFTGSLMPKGSDTLIPIENVEVNGDEIKIIKEVTAGFAVRDVAENYKKGEVLIKKELLLALQKLVY